MTLTTLMLAYHLAHWDTLYETPETRRIRKLSYYAKPNNTVGECIGFMLTQPNGLELYGTFTFVLEGLASTAPAEWRGWLVRNGSPMDAARMSHLTRVPQETIQRALEFFSTPPMDWLEHIEWPEVKQGALIAPPADNRVDNGHGMGAPSSGHGMGAPSEHPADSLRAPTRGKIDRESKEREKKEIRKAASPEEAEQQVRQFAANQSLLAELEAIPDDDRTADQSRELKKRRAVLKTIKARQAAGDFRPVEEAV